jgi:hypothetical protein
MLERHQQDVSTPFVTARHLQSIQAKWDRLTAADLSHVYDQSQLIDRVCERYSLPREQAEQDVALWLAAGRFRA